MGIKDTRMLAQAVKNAYPITAEHKAAIVKTLMLIALDPKNYKARERIAAAKAVLLADAMNLQMAQLDQNNQHHQDKLNNARLDRVALIASQLGHTGIVDAIAAERSSGNFEANGGDAGTENT